MTACSGPGLGGCCEPHLRAAHLGWAWSVASGSLWHATRPDASAHGGPVPLAFGSSLLLLLFSLRAMRQQHRAHETQSQTRSQTQSHLMPHLRVDLLSNSRARPLFFAKWQLRSQHKRCFLRQGEPMMPSSSLSSSAKQRNNGQAANEAQSV